MSTFWQNRRHARVRTLLSSYIDGEVSASEARRVAAHLSGCDECVAELESLRATTTLLGQLPSLDTPRSYALTAADVQDMSPRRGLPSFAGFTRRAGDGRGCCASRRAGGGRRVPRASGLYGICCCSSSSSSSIRCRTCASSPCCGCPSARCARCSGGQSCCTCARCSGGCNACCCGTSDEGSHSCAGYGSSSSQRHRQLKQLAAPAAAAMMDGGQPSARLLLLRRRRQQLLLPVQWLRAVKESEEIVEKESSKSSGN